MSMLDRNAYRQQLVATVEGLGKLSPDSVNAAAALANSTPTLDAFDAASNA